MSEVPLYTPHHTAPHRTAPHRGLAVPRANLLVSVRAGREVGLWVEALGLGAEREAPGLLLLMYHSRYRT